MKKIKKRMSGKINGQTGNLMDKKHFCIIAFVFVVFILFSHGDLKIAKASNILNNPRIVEDDTMIYSGQKVTWDCVWFGSYPQAEVVSSETASNYSAISAEYLKDEDLVISDSIYSKLEQASGWNNRGDIVIDGIKYRRIKKTDAPITMDYGDVYQWNNNTDYHYFQYQPIKWRILNISNNQALLLSDKILDTCRYNAGRVSITWENSTIRSWLNNYNASFNSLSKDYSAIGFLNDAFTHEQQEAVNVSFLNNADNIEYGTNGGNDTEDLIFLLSESDMCVTDTAKQYGFIEGRGCDEGRMAWGSTYARAHGVEIGGLKGAEWWLRSPGTNNLIELKDTRVLHIYNGGINPDGDRAAKYDGNARPALSLNLSCNSVWSYAGTVCSDGTKKETGELLSEYDELMERNNDLSLIELVEKYTDDTSYAQFNAIMQDTCDEEEKFRRLNELFLNDGITDIHEGISYLSECSKYRRDYLYLTTNDNFCAFNWYNWLNTTPDGKACRGLLWEMGLIYNWEIDDYFDITNIDEKRTPEISKSYDLLRNFITSEDSNFVSDLTGNTKKIVDQCNLILKINEIKVDEDAREIFRKLLNAKTKTEKNEYQILFCKYLEKSVRTDKLYFDGKPFAQAMKKGAGILEFTNATSEDIFLILNLSDELEKYYEYSDFLDEIINCEYMTSSMRAAAYFLKDDMEHAYLNSGISILLSSIKLSDDLKIIELGTNDLQSWLEEIGKTGLAEAIETINIARKLANVVIDTGEFVKNAAYTQGYAQLSMMYAIKLQTDKQNFLNNKSVENAEQFIRDYSLLWSLRYNGEKQYLSMNEMKSLFILKFRTYNYYYKESVVNAIIAFLDTCKMDSTVEEIVNERTKYKNKCVIECPVNIKVYTQSGDLVAQLLDGEESSISNEYGDFYVVYEPYSGEYAKVICQKASEKLDIQLIAESDGVVDFKSLSEDDEVVKCFDQLAVEQGDHVYITEDTYQIDTDSDGIFDTECPFVEKNINEYIPVENARFLISDLSMRVGDKNIIKMEISPENATNTSVSWYALDESIVQIQNGVITALEPGRTTIVANICDSNSLRMELPVVVTDGLAEMAGASISLEGNIGVNFYMLLNENVIADPSSYMEFYLEGGANQKIYVTQQEDKSLPFAVKDTTTTQGKTYYKFQYNVAAKEMADTITAQIHLSDGTVSTEYTYSVKQYADYLFAHAGKNEDYAKAVELIRSMLNYGAYSQDFFLHNTDSPANMGSITMEQLEVLENVTAETIDSCYDSNTEFLPEGVSFVGASLELESETVLNLYFSKQDSMELIFKDSNGKVLPQKLIGGYVQVSVNNIAAQNLDNIFEIKLQIDGDDAVYSVSYSPMNYCYNVLSKQTTETRTDTLKNLVRALYLYNQQAKIYFNGQ